MKTIFIVLSLLVVVSARSQYVTDVFTATTNEVADGLNQTKPVTPWGLKQSGVLGSGGSFPSYAITNHQSTEVNFRGGLSLGDADNATIASDGSASFAATVTGASAFADSAGTANGNTSHADSNADSNGDFSHADSNGDAEGNYSHADSNGTANSNTSHADSNGTANGDFSHADAFATANGNYSHADSSGYANSNTSHADSNGDAEGNYSHADSFATAYSDFSHADSSGYANSDYSHADAGGTARLSASSAAGGTEDADVASPQTTTRFVISSDATTHAIMTDYTFPAQGVYMLDFVVLARSEDTSPLVSTWHRQLVIEVNSAPTATILQVNTIGTDVNTFGGTPTISFDCIGANFYVRETGLAAKNIRWSATFRETGLYYNPY